MKEENTKPKKESKKAAAPKTNGVESENFGAISTKEDLKTFLLGIRDRLADQSAAAIYAVSAINFALNLPTIYTLLDNENKEIARDIWLRVKQSGMQLRNPPLLFQPEEATLGTTP
jgi:hypothetical protein